MKKTTKILSLVMAAVLLVGASVMGTLAYLTSTDEVTNTFSVGSVAIILDEAKANPDGSLVEGAARVDANSYKLKPGHTYNKDPMVTVKAGSEESYIRIIVTVNEKADLDAIGINTLEVFQGYDSTKWTLASQNAGENDTMVYEFRYNTTVSTVGAADKALEPLFTKIVVPGDITNEQLATIAGLEIKIVANAIQADGFADANAAWNAFAN